MLLSVSEPPHGLLLEPMMMLTPKSLVPAVAGSTGFEVGSHPRPPAIRALLDVDRARSLIGCCVGCRESQQISETRERGCTAIRSRGRKRRYPRRHLWAPDWVGRASNGVCRLLCC